MSWHAQRMSSRRRKQSWKWSAVAVLDQSRATHFVLIVSAPWYFADGSNVKLSTKTQDIIESSLADKNSVSLASRAETLIAQHNSDLVFYCQPPYLGGRGHGAPEHDQGNTAMMRVYNQCM